MRILRSAAVTSAFSPKRCGFQLDIESLIPISGFATKFEWLIGGRRGATNTRDDLTTTEP